MTMGRKNVSIAPEDDGPAVAFQHPFFAAVENGHFRLSEGVEEPCFVIRLSEDDVVLPLGGIRREFDIAEDSADGKMLALVAEALNYVKVLRIGHPLPKEVTTGEASWEIEEEHRVAAYQRLTLQLASWMSGSETALTSREELSQIADDPKTRESINAAFAEAAAGLGLGPDGPEKVVQMIEALAGELAHVEALRDRFDGVRMMLEKAKDLRRVYAQEASVRENADACVRMLTVAVPAYQQIFEVIDAQTSEIMAALKNIDSQRDFIRTIRNDLYKRLSAWTEVLEAWKRIEPLRSRYNEEWLVKTYRFLAPRFLTVDEWELQTRYEPRRDPKTEWRWSDDSYHRQDAKMTSFAEVVAKSKRDGPAARRN